MSSSTSSPRRKTVACLPGDCIGPEVMAAAKRILAALAPDVELEDHPFGGAAIRSHGDSLPEETLEACRRADAVLKAPIGDPEFGRDRAEVEAAIRRRQEGRPDDGTVGRRRMAS